LKEFGDKIPADKRGAIETALGELKTAFESKELPAVEAALSKINTAWQQASEDIYKAQQGGAAQGPNPNATNPFGDANPFGGQQGGNNGPDVQDVDFEEVK
jgi:chaperone protein dnaK